MGLQELVEEGGDVTPVRLTRITPSEFRQSAATPLLDRRGRARHRVGCERTGTSRTTTIETVRAVASRRKMATTTRTRMLDATVWIVRRHERAVVESRGSVVVPVVASRRLSRSSSRSVRRCPGRRPGGRRRGRPGCRLRHPRSRRRPRPRRPRRGRDAAAERSRVVPPPGVGPLADATAGGGGDRRVCRRGRRWRCDGRRRWRRRAGSGAGGRCRRGGRWRCVVVVEVVVVVAGRLVVSSWSWGWSSSVARPAAAPARSATGRPARWPRGRGRTWRRRRSPPARRSRGGPGCGARPGSMARARANR